MTSVLLGSSLKTNNNYNIENKYSNTYFRIDTDAYHHNDGWDEEKKHDYEVELYEILTKQGWDMEAPARDYAAMTAEKGKSFLYLHPQNYSGVCENVERERLFRAFNEAKTFSCRAVDVYEEIFDMTDEHLNEKLNNEMQDIEKEILEALTTKRNNLYIVDIGYHGVCGNIGKKHSVKRLTMEGTRNCYGVDNRTDGICKSFVSEIFKRLIEENKIVSAKTKSGVGYRTANKKDGVV